MEPVESQPVSANHPVVLLVDDDPEVLRGFRRILGGLDFPIESCDTAECAVERVARGGIHVVVSDISLPGMNGIELLRAIREYDPDLPVVMVTGQPAVETATEAIEYGAFKYIVKPVKPELLTSTVERAAQVYRLARLKRQALTALGRSSEASDLAGLESNFEKALASMWMAFQPILRTSDRSLFGYEALLRSNEPSLPNPAAVIKAAEELGELDRLGRSVRDLCALSCLRMSDGLTLFVNLHPKDLGDPHLLDVGSMLAPLASRVVLEITERASIGNVDQVSMTIGALRKMGFRIAVDDLGAGYAGLNSFALLEPEFVKLDMTLVRGIDQSPTKRKVVGSMTTLCKDMGCLVVAEGVETSEERDALVELGCDLVQGYFFARPGPPFPEVSWAKPTALPT